MWMATTDDRGVVKYWQTNMNNVHTFQAHSEAIRGCRCDQERGPGMLSTCNSTSTCSSLACDCLSVTCTFCMCTSIRVSEYEFMCRSSVLLCVCLDCALVCVSLNAALKHVARR